MTDLKLQLRRLFQEDGVEVGDRFLDQVAGLVQGAAWDRDKARDVLLRQDTYVVDGWHEDLLDALEACVAPVPAHTIDRDALPYDPVLGISELHLAEGAGWRDRDKFEAAVTSILRDVRVVVHMPHLDIEAHATAYNEGWDAAVAQVNAEPVGGVILTREEAALAASLLRSHLSQADGARGGRYELTPEVQQVVERYRDLAARLEASS